jgi:hypothetical protein
MPEARLQKTREAYRPEGVVLPRHEDPREDDAAFAAAYRAGERILVSGGTWRAPHDNAAAQLARHAERKDV